MCFRRTWESRQVLSPNYYMDALRDRMVPVTLCVHISVYTYIYVSLYIYIYKHISISMYMYCLKQCSCLRDPDLKSCHMQPIDERRPLFEAQPRASKTRSLRNGRISSWCSYCNFEAYLDLQSTKATAYIPSVFWGNGNSFGYFGGPGLFLS